MTESESNELIEKMQNESIRSRVELHRRNNVRVCSCVENMYLSGRERASFSGPRGLAPFEALSVASESYDEQREKYYTSLAKAEAIRKEHIAPNKASNLSMFMLLCEANIYRSENYILPSTVIHVVRDIQAKAQKPASPLVPECKLYHARLATCALGRFTYLCSAMEQIGYMERFSYDSGKIAKYKGRLDLALKEYAEHSQTGGKRSYRKRSRRNKAKKAKKTRKLK